jgi:hypothetical protein
MWSCIPTLDEPVALGQPVPHSAGRRQGCYLSIEQLPLRRHAPVRSESGSLPVRAVSRRGCGCPQSVGRPWRVLRLVLGCWPGDEDGLSYCEIAAALDTKGIRPKRGERWHPGDRAADARQRSQLPGAS